MKPVKNTDINDSIKGEAEETDGSSNGNNSSDKIVEEKNPFRSYSNNKNNKIFVR